MGFWRLHVPPAQKVADSVGRRRFIFAVVTKDVTTLIIYYYCSFDVRCSTECGDAYTTIQSRLTTSHPLTLFYTRLHTIWFLFMKTVGRFWFTNNYNSLFSCARKDRNHRLIVRFLTQSSILNTRNFASIDFTSMCNLHEDLHSIRAHNIALLRRCIFAICFCLTWFMIIRFSIKSGCIW